MSTDVYIDLRQVSHTHTYTRCIKILNVTPICFLSPIDAILNSIVTSSSTLTYHCIVPTFVCIFFFISNVKFLSLIFIPTFHQFFFFFLNDPAPPEISPLPLPDPLPISKKSTPLAPHRARTDSSQRVCALHDVLNEIIAEFNRRF